MVRVAVTAAETRAGLACVRSLGRAGHEVVGCVTRAPLPSLRSRFADAPIVVSRTPDPQALAGQLEARRVDVLLPMGTPWVRYAVDAQTVLERAVRMLLPERDSFARVYDKRELLALCRRLGIPCAEPLEPGGAVGRMVVKPVRDVGGAQGVRYVDDARQAAVLLAANPDQLFASRYVPGPPCAMRAVTLLFDRHTRLVAASIVRKLVQYPATGGNIVLGETTAEWHLLERLLPLFEHLRWRGPAEVELKIDEADGEPRVIEVNPRLPGYVRLFEHGRLPITDMLVRAALGESLACRLARPGVLYGNAGLLLHRVLQRSDPALALADLRALLGRGPRTRWFLLADLADPLPRIEKLLRKLSRAAGSGPADPHPTAA